MCDIEIINGHYKIYIVLYTILTSSNILHSLGFALIYYMCDADSIRWESPGASEVT